MDRSVVLVTGASHGLGKASAALLAAQGCQVFGTAVSRRGTAQFRLVQRVRIVLLAAEGLSSCVIAGAMTDPSLSALSQVRGLETS